jgi:hypothetical protein
MMKKLDEKPDRSPFKIPENYFEEVNRKIISATSGYSLEVKKNRSHNRLRNYLAIAASVAGLVLISYTASKFLSHDRKNPVLAELMFEGNSDLFINDIDIFALEENASSLIFSDEVPDVNKTDIIDHLLLENIDISDIYK